LKWNFSNDHSIAPQIVEMIQTGILAGFYPLGSALPSVRALAVEAGVNPNTMQKALAELEAQGLLYTQRTSGRTVTTDERLIMELKERRAHDYIRHYFEGMQSLGIARDRAAEMLAASASASTSADTSASDTKATTTTTNTTEVN